MADAAKRLVRCPHCSTQMRVSTKKPVIFCPTCKGSIDLSSAPEASASPSPDQPPPKNAPQQTPARSLGEYLGRYWKTTRGGWLLPVFFASLIAIALSLLKPLIGLRGIFFLTATIGGLFVLALLAFLVIRTVAYTIGRRRVVDEDARSIAARVAFASLVTLLFPFAPLAVAEIWGPNEGHVAGCLPTLKQPQAQVLRVFDRVGTVHRLTAAVRGTAEEDTVNAVAATEPNTVAFAEPAIKNTRIPAKENDAEKRPKPAAAKDAEGGAKITPAKVEKGGPDSAAAPDSNAQENAASKQTQVPDKAKAPVAEDSVRDREPLTVHERDDATKKPTDMPPKKGESENTVVVAEGAGTTKEEALKDAFRAAVRQVVGEVVDAETLVKNEDVVKDQVLTYSDGFVPEHQELSATHDNGIFRVSIRAQVRRRSVIMKLRAANVTTKEVAGQSIFGELVTQ